jgi:hypothetical protein
MANQPLWVTCVEKPELIRQSMLPHMPLSGEWGELAIYDLLNHIVQHQESLEILQFLVHAGSRLPYFFINWNKPPTQMERDAMRIMIQHDVNWLPAVLCTTIMDDCPEVIDYAFQRGMPAKDLNKHNGFKLAHMLKNGYSAEYLLNNGADTSVTLGENGNYSLLHAVTNVDDARALVHHGADPHQECGWKQTVLFGCSKNVKLLRFFIEECHCNPLHIDKRHRTVLDEYLGEYRRHMASSSNEMSKRFQVIEYLLHHLVEQRLAWTETSIFRRELREETGEMQESCWDIALSIAVSGDPRIQDLLVSAWHRMRASDLSLSEFAASCTQSYLPFELHGLVANYCSVSP